MARIEVLIELVQLLMIKIDEQQEKIDRIEGLIDQIDNRV